jgi:quinol monooxygenase YgiN
MGCVSHAAIMRGQALRAMGKSAEFWKSSGREFDKPPPVVSLFPMIRNVLVFMSILALSSIAQAAGEFRHVVLFKFKADAPAEKITALEKAFAELPEKIDAITGFEWGTNVSEEGHDKGFTHCFLVTFKDKAGLDAYLPHPAHKAFVEQLKPLMEDVTVIDYVAR